MRTIEKVKRGDFTKLHQQGKNPLMKTTTALVFADMPKAIADKVDCENTMEIVDVLVDYRIC